MGAKTWDETVMDKDQIFGVIISANKDAAYSPKYYTQNKVELRATAKAQAKITGGIAYNAGQESMKPDPKLRKRAAKLFRCFRNCRIYPSLCRKPPSKCKTPIDDEDYVWADQIIALNKEEE